jgi:hypothetical protein
VAVPAVIAAAGLTAIMAAAARVVSFLSLTFICQCQQ